MASEKRVGKAAATELPEPREDDGKGKDWRSKSGSNTARASKSPTKRASGQIDPATGKAGLPKTGSPSVDVDLVISTLRIPEGGAEVVKAHANEQTADKQIQAYAKLAGRDWTYYVQQLELVIGRTAADSTERVDIDLAPSKIVSRRHAVIRYNLSARIWEVVTFGRNGVRIDNTLVRAGNTVSLSSGNVLDVGNVQMMFVLPDADPVVAPIYLKRLREIQSAGSSAQSGNSRPNSSGPHCPHPRGELPAVAAPNAPRRTTETSSAYPRGVTIISRPQVPTSQYLVQDLGSDECKDIKPPFSYATMISQAILSAPEEMMTLADIYLWIAGHYAFYRHSKPGWQNSIRHNLSLNKAFEKVARKENEPGKGAKWHIVDAYKEELVKKAMSGRGSRGGYMPRRVEEDSQPTFTRKRTYAETGCERPNEGPSIVMPPQHLPQPTSQPFLGQSHGPSQPSQLDMSRIPQFQMPQGPMPVLSPGQQQQPFHPSYAYPSMGEAASFPIQGFPYVPPYGMLYYPGQPAMPMVTMPQQSEQTQAEHKAKGQASEERQQEKNDTSHSLDSKYCQRDPSEKEKASNSSSDKISDRPPGDLRTPARSALPQTRNLGDTPLLLDSAVKLAPNPDTTAPESSPALWKYMNLESTPNNNANNASNTSKNNASRRPNDAESREDFGPASSPPDSVRRRDSGCVNALPMEGSKA